MDYMKLSLVIQTPEVERQVPTALLSGSLEEKLSKAAQFGADGVELMTVEPSRIDLKVLRNRLRENGLQVSAVASGALAFAAGLTLLNPDATKQALARERLNELILFASQLGAPLVTIGSFRGRLAWGGPTARDDLLRILRESSQFARMHGLQIALEPLNRYEADLVNNVQEGLDFITEVGEPSIGLLLDTFHVNIEEQSWTEPFQRALQASRLLHVHLGDNNRLAPGQGMINFGLVVNTLRLGGYNGFLSAELLPRPDPDRAARLTLDYMRPLLRV